MLRSMASTMGSKRDRDSEKEILEVESKFGEAMIQNDVEAIGRILSDDWIIIDPDGGVVDKSRFLDVIKSGALKHEAMDSEDIRVRTYPNSATSRRYKYQKQILGERVHDARKGYGRLREEEWAVAMRAHSPHHSH